MTPNPNLLKYKDKHKGQRVFMVGNGPSLNDMDLDLLTNEVSFGMNRIAMIYPKTKWRPDYYVFSSTNIVDRNWGQQWLQSVRKAIKEPKTTPFIWRKFFQAILSPGPIHGYIEWLNGVTENGVGNNTFSTDVSRWIDKSGTTMNVALQIAAYMGFKQVFLLGVDLNWTTTDSSDGDPNHFDPAYCANIANGEWERAHMRRTHMTAYNRMRELDIDVYNVTPNTFLDIYPLADYKNVVVNKNWYGKNKDDIRWEEGIDIGAHRIFLNDYWENHPYKDKYTKADQ